MKMDNFIEYHFSRCKTPQQAIVMNSFYEELEKLLQSNASKEKLDELRRRILSYEVSIDNQWIPVDFITLYEGDYTNN